MSDLPRDDIIRLAREAGLVSGDPGPESSS